MSLVDIEPQTARMGDYGGGFMRAGLSSDANNSASKCCVRCVWYFKVDSS